MVAFPEKQYGHTRRERRHIPLENGLSFLLPVGKASSLFSFPFCCANTEWCPEPQAPCRTEGSHRQTSDPLCLVQPQEDASGEGIQPHSLFRQSHIPPAPPVTNNPGKPPHSLQTQQGPVRTPIRSWEASALPLICESEAFTCEIQEYEMGTPLLRPSQTKQIHISLSFLPAGQSAALWLTTEVKVPRVRFPDAFWYRVIVSAEDLQSSAAQT